MISGLKSLGEACAISFSMYTRFPMVQVNWNERNLAYALIFYPLTGILCVLGLGASWWVCDFFGLSSMIFASMAMLLTEVLLIGGIHWDGFCDTIDALASHKEREEKLRILKDPNAGAFAVIYACAAFIFQFALFTQLYNTPDLLVFMALGYILARIIGASLLIILPSAHKSGLGVSFGKGADKNIVLACLAVFFIIIFLIYFLLQPILTGVILLLTVIFMLWFRSKILREFGGMSGDMVGFCLTIYLTLLLLILVIGGSVL